MFLSISRSTIYSQNSLERHTLQRYIRLPALFTAKRIGMLFKLFVRPANSVSGTGKEFQQTNHRFHYYSMYVTTAPLFVRWLPAVVSLGTGWLPIVREPA